MHTLKIRQLYNFVAAIALSVVITILYSGVSSAAGLDVPQSQPGPYTGDLANNPIIQWIQFFANLLAVIIIAGSIVMIAVAGVQYTMARDNPQAVQAAKQRIWNVVIGLFAYAFLYAFLQWLVPGGLW